MRDILRDGERFGKDIWRMPFGIQSNLTVSGKYIDYSKIRTSKYDIPVLCMKDKKPYYVYTSLEEVKRSKEFISIK